MHSKTNSIVLNKAKEWLSDVYDEKTRKEVQYLIDHNHEELNDAFYKDLEFGTGGLRGLMGVGTNRMNVYTIAIATQGLCNYLKDVFKGSQIKVAIAFDTRNNSKMFARKIAEVFSANGIQVYLFDSPRPTPELSFTVRHLKCQSGVVVTASHNPKEYNGYKVYWQDGGQLVPPHDNNVIHEVRKITGFSETQTAPIENNIHIIGDEIDSIYLKKIKSLSTVDNDKSIRIVYTSLHGTGIISIPPALEITGFSNVTIVKEQSIPDGNFPTVKSPNPEEPEALELAIIKAKAIHADIVLGTDPDADRVGIALEDNHGDYLLLNGNQAYALFVNHLLNKWQKTKNRELDKTLVSKEGFVITTIVTSDLIDDIAEAHKVECINTLTGFKYIAEQIRLHEGNKQFICGGEESYGYLLGNFVLDKDAVSAAVIFCEIAAEAKANNSSMFEKLLDIYVKYGFYKERLISIIKKGKKGVESIQKMMTDFRENPPVAIAGSEVMNTIDYLNDKTGLRESNVLQFFLADGSKITVRPSGTEPKIKFYFSVKTKLRTKEEYDSINQQLEARIDNLALEFYSE